MIAKPLAPIVFFGGLTGVDQRPHGAIQEEDALGQQFFQNIARGNRHAVPHPENQRPGRTPGRAEGYFILDSIEQAEDSIQMSYRSASVGDAIYQSPERERRGFGA